MYTGIWTRICIHLHKHLFAWLLLLFCIHFKMYTHSIYYITSKLKRFYYLWYDFVETAKIVVAQIFMCKNPRFCTLEWVQWRFFFIYTWTPLWTVHMSKKKMLNCHLLTKFVWFYWWIFFFGIQLFFLLVFLFWFWFCDHGRRQYH